MVSVKTKVVDLFCAFLFLKKSNHMLLQSISHFEISKLGSMLGPPILSSSQNKGTCWSQWSAGRRLLFSFLFEADFIQLVVLNLSHLNYIKLCLFLTSNER